MHRTQQIENDFQAKYKSVVMAKLGDLDLTGIYGRDEECAALRETGCQLVRVRGESGAGKSALILHALGHEKWFVSGKFDQHFQRFSAIVDCCNQLCDKIASGGAKLRMDDVYVRTLSRASIGIERILMEDSYDVVRMSREAMKYKQEAGFARLKHAFRAFFEATCRCAGSSSRVILNLEDIQWANSDSLAILKTILDDGGIPGLLVVVSFRSNEIGDQLMEFISEQPSETMTLDIKVTNLGRDATNRMVSGMLRSEEDDVIQFSELIFIRSMGNVFFTSQIVQYLRSKDVLRFSRTKLKWEWDTNAIKAQVDVTENVAKFMVHKLQSFPSETQETLAVASCLGNIVDVQLLETVVEVVFDQIEEQSKRSALDVLDVVVDESLIIMSENNKRFRFAHDKVYEAAYGAAYELTGKSKESLHYTIGKCIQSAYVNSNKGWRLVLAVEQLNRGKSIDDSEDAQLALCELNAKVADQLKESGAFHRADYFLRTGMELLGDRRWQNHYSLTLKMKSKLARMQLSNGADEACLKLVHEIFENARAPEDLYDTHIVHIEALASLNRLSECLDAGLRTLTALGHKKIPRRPGFRHVILHVIKTKRLLSRLSPDEIVNLPVCTDERLLTAQSILSFLCPIGLFNNREEFIPILSCRIIELSVKHGIGNDTPTAIASFGFGMTAIPDFDAASMFGDIAVRMMDKLGIEDPRTLCVTNAHIAHLRTSIQDTIEPTFKAYQSAFAQGDQFFTGQAAALHMINRFVAGLDLETLVDDGFLFCDQLKRHNAKSGLDVLLSLQRMMLEIVDRPAGMKKLTEINLNDEQFAFTVLNPVVVAFYYRTAMLARFLSGDNNSALEFATKCYRSKALKGMYAYLPFFNCYSALIALDAWRSTKRRYYLRMFRRVQKEITTWVVEQGYPNSIHHMYLLDAEAMSVRGGQVSDIRRSFEKALATASRSGRVQDSALVKERLGLFFSSGSGKDTHWAEHFIIEATTTYETWGAAAKVRSLKKVHESILQNSQLCSEKFNPLVGRSRRASIEESEYNRNAPVVKLSTLEDESAISIDFQ